jgi:nucleotide-binding universal stress UspA family protein
MKILLAADGSDHTKKALAFLVNNMELLGKDGQVFVVHVQPPMPPRVKTMVGAATVQGYYEEEAGKVLAPIEEFLKRHQIAFEARWLVGSPGAEIVKAAQQEKAHMVLMGTHGHGLIGRAVMGSVAQNVLADCEVPVLLVK